MMNHMGFLKTLLGQPVGFPSHFDLAYCSPATVTFDPVSSTSHFVSDMSQESQHGKWAVSSSDDDDGDPRPAPLNTARPSHPKPSDSNHNNSQKIHSLFKSKQEPVPTPSPASALVVKSESPLVQVTTPSASPAIGSEARQAAHARQSNPVKYEPSPSRGEKRKKDADDSGWALSDSDDEDDKGMAVSSAQHRGPARRSSPSPKPKRPKVEDHERPPSPYGRVYYIDEPDDFFETSVPSANDTYRLYLNKVTGLEKKYNTGALHIRGEPRGCVDTALTSDTDSKF